MALEVEEVTHQDNKKALSLVAEGYPGVLLNSVPPYLVAEVVVVVGHPLLHPERNSLSSVEEAHHFLEEEEHPVQLLGNKVPFLALEAGHPVPLRDS